MQLFSLLLAGVLVTVFAAGGQAARPDDPGAPAKANPYSSVTSGTKSYRPVAPLPWGDVNRRVDAKASSPGQARGARATATQAVKCGRSPSRLHARSRTRRDMDSRGTFEWSGRQARLAALLLGVAASAGGCAKFSPDGGMLAVQAAAGTELGKEVGKIRDDRDAAIVAARVKALQARPLTASSAVQIALLNNRGLQAAYQRARYLGSPDGGGEPAAGADRGAGPARSAPAGFEIERHDRCRTCWRSSTLPRRREIAEARFRAGAGARGGDHPAHRCRGAPRLLPGRGGQRDRASSSRRRAVSAEAVSDLAKQLGETGAMSASSTRRASMSSTPRSAASSRPRRLRQRTERERLIRALGLWGGGHALPAAGQAAASPGQTGNGRGRDRERGRRPARRSCHRAMELDILAQQLGLTRRTRFINVLEVAG